MHNKNQSLNNLDYCISPGLNFLIHNGTGRKDRTEEN